MSKTVYPEHYTPEDVDAINEIKGWLESRGISQAALARVSRISATSLNQVIKGVYAASPSKLLSSIVSAMRHADETQADVLPAVETSVYRLAMTAFQMARRYRNFSVLSAFVGTGKTYAARHYQRTTPNTYLIEATPFMTTQSLVKQLARLVTGVEGKGSMDDRFMSIVDSLANTDSLLIVDEAETLTPHVLHTLRRLRDMANVGITLVGTEYLTALIKPERGQFDQIRSRAGFWPETVRSINGEDSAALVQAAFGAEEVPDDVIARMHAYCRGSARMLVEGLVASLQQFRKGRALDVALVDAVAKQALCLQPIG